MRRRQAFVPEALRPLEDRVVMSASTASAITPIPSPPVVGPILPIEQLLNLQGTVKGAATESGRPTTTTSTPQLALKGSGPVSPLGMADLQGSLSVRNGEPTFIDGKVVLTNRLGSVAIELQGIHGGPITPTPTFQLHYKIVGGTGAYRYAVGSGSATISFAHNPDGSARSLEFSLTFGNPHRVHPLTSST